ncbi:MAG TPA: 7-cyano-7-deazaguanine synthase [Gammaproteobacteria bacterium]|nr:7-cyano-7-deazaguanine synthase [Gammaproteobacteria bacterium]
MPIEPEASQAGRILVLVSGGIESTTLMHQAARQGVRVLPVFLDYGQRPAARELAAARAHAGDLGLEVEVMDMAETAQTFREGQERHYHIPLPHRNLVALSLGLSLAEQRSAERLRVGITREDAEVSASASASFLDTFVHMARLLGSIKVEAPLRDMTKAEVIETGANLGVDFGKTYSCLLGYPKPCGRCPQCRKRRAAFDHAGIIEPPFQLPFPGE